MDNIGISLDFFSKGSAILTFRHRAGQHKFFICMRLEISLYQIHRAFFRRNTPHIKNILIFLQAIFLFNDVTRQWIIELDCIGNQNCRAIVFLQKVIPFTF